MSEQYPKLQFLTDLIFCFGDISSTRKFCDNINIYPIKPEIKKFTAYRSIILTPSGEPEKYSWKKNELDVSRIAGVLSWSRSLNGADYYCKKHVESSRIIVLEGEIEGFDLLDYCQKVMNHYKDNQECEPYLESLKRQIDLYYKEEEIVSINIINYYILKDEKKEYI